MIKASSNYFGYRIDGTIFFPITKGRSSLSNILAPEICTYLPPNIWLYYSLTEIFTFPQKLLFTTKPSNASTISNLSNAITYKRLTLATSLSRQIRTIKIILKN
jgi:hypothetical protein